MPMTPGERAVQALELEDIFLLESDCKVKRDYNPTQIWTNMVCGHSMEIENTVMTQSRTLIGHSEPSLFLVRFIVTGTFKLAMPEIDELPEGDIPEDKLLATLRLVFAADYSCKASFFEDKEAIGAFARNVGFHTWPFWREALNQQAARMRLPKVLAPMNKPTPPTGPIKIIELADDK
jgi:hypothetical protein